MNSISVLVIIIMAIYAGIAHLDALSTQFGLFTPLFAGALTGLLMGDLNAGLTIGATLQLATLGIATYGGASVPDFLSGSIIGTAIAISAGDVGLGLTLATAVGLILTQLDVFARMINVVFQHMADAAAQKGDFATVERSNLLGMITWFLSRSIPVAVGLALGTQLEGVTGWIPNWIMDGLRYAGGLLPAMGIAILMRYLPLKKFFAFFVIGFVLMAYFAAQFSILGVALVGFALAAIYFMFKGMFAPKGSKGSDNDSEVEIDG